MISMTISMVMSTGSSPCRLRSGSWRALCDYVLLCLFVYIHIYIYIYIYIHIAIVRFCTIIHYIILYYIGCLLGALWTDWRHRGDMKSTTEVDKYIYIYIYICIHTHTHIHTHIYIYIYIYTCIYTYWYSYMRIRTYIYIYIFMYTRVCIIVSLCSTLYYSRVYHIPIPYITLYCIILCYII